MQIFIIIVIIIVLLIALVGYILSNYSVNINRQSMEEARKWQEEHYDISWFDPLVKERYTVSSYDEYKLHVTLLKNPVPTDKYILISHGYTDNRYGSLKYTKMYLDLGFNVILYDLRGHGENDKTYCTYSIRESMDLDQMITDCRTRYPDATLFGIHGESLGAATSIAVLKYKPDIDFVIADCGFSEIKSVMWNGLRGFHLPGWLVNIASQFTRLRYGYFYYEMSPIKSLEDNEIPILFIHGEKDDFIYPFHSEEMEKTTKGYSEVRIIPEATHAASVLYDPEGYKQFVQGFLEKVTADK